MERSEAVSLVNRAHYGKVRHKWVSHLRKELETTGGNWGFEEVGKGNRIFGELSEGERVERGAAPQNHPEGVYWD